MAICHSPARFWPAAVLILTVLAGADLRAQRPSTDRHVPEMAAFLDRVQIAEPLRYRNLSVYPILLEDGGARLADRWLTLDQAIARGLLVVYEKAEGSVPVVTVENRSRDEHVLLMTGEVIAGGMQTRTIRQDVILAPGQRIDLDVYCVEAHRWSGKKEFSAANVLVPQSIQQELRGGGSQQSVWSGVARNNAALKAENATGSLELALNSAPIREKLKEIHRDIVPRIPEGTRGFIFVSHGRAVGAEMFGAAELARSLLPKLLDSYAVDYVIIYPKAYEGEPSGGNRAAIEYFERICRAGSDRAHTPGSGSGIRTRTDGLLGDGVGLGGSLVHYGAQNERRIVPKPIPMPHPRPEPMPRRPMIQE